MQPIIERGSADTIQGPTIFTSLPTARTAQTRLAAVTFRAGFSARNTGSMASLPSLLSKVSTVGIPHCAACC